MRAASSIVAREAGTGARSEPVEDRRGDQETPNVDAVGTTIPRQADACRMLTGSGRVLSMGDQHPESRIWSRGRGLVGWVKQDHERSIPGAHRRVRETDLFGDAVIDRRRTSPPEDHSKRSAI